MRVPCTILLLFLFGASDSAQALSNPSDVPNVVVVQKKWRIEVRNPKLEKDPLLANKEQQQDARDRKDVVEENENRTKQGLPHLPPPARVPAPETGARGLSVTYVYEVKVRNSGVKGIRTLTWEYVFFEPGTEVVVGRRRFVSKVSISPGRTKNVVMRSASSPTGTIDATKAGKKSQDQYSEQVFIQSVGYADGSVWQAASN